MDLKDVNLENVTKVELNMDIENDIDWQIFNIPKVEEVQPNDEDIYAVPWLEEVNKFRKSLSFEVDCNTQLQLKLQQDPNKLPILRLIQTNKIIDFDHYQYTAFKSNIDFYCRCIIEGFDVCEVMVPKYVGFGVRVHMNKITDNLDISNPAFSMSVPLMLIFRIQKCVRIIEEIDCRFKNVSPHLDLHRTCREISQCAYCSY